MDRPGLPFCLETIILNRVPSHSLATFSDDQEFPDGSDKQGSANAGTPLSLNLTQDRTSLRDCSKDPIIQPQ